MALGPPEQPIIRGRVGPLAPFDQQPFTHPDVMHLLAPAMCGPNRHEEKAGALGTLGALTPSHEAPLPFQCLPGDCRHEIAGGKSTNRG